MAKRKLLQWMRDQLKEHAEKVVLCSAEKKALDAAYKKAAPLVTAILHQKFPPSEMKVLAKWKATSFEDDPKLSTPDGSVTQFIFDKDDYPMKPNSWDYDRQIYIANATVASAIEKWIIARDAYKAERKKRLDAYSAMIDGSSTVEDLIGVWPEAAGVLPSGSPPIALGPEQIAIIKADLRERKAA